MSRYEAWQGCSIFGEINIKYTTANYPGNSYVLYGMLLHSEKNVRTIAADSSIPASFKGKVIDLSKAAGLTNTIARGWIGWLAGRR